MSLIVKHSRPSANSGIWRRTALPHRFTWHIIFQSLPTGAIMPQLTGAQIRQSFIDFFISKGHTFVPSSSLVPGGDATLLFTNAGMVQFKDVFLGTDKRPYKRAVNSQKCMRVAGKHNDLDEVGRDGSHHTFFEMLGNWSFGDYYKADAIAWSWELLTVVWGLPKDKLYATVFRDDATGIPADKDAADNWLKQPGFDPAHLSWLPDNLWEMAETGPTGPCTEIHFDMGLDCCSQKEIPGHVCEVGGTCGRFVELWNNVFMQYNRLGSDELTPLPATHVDTGMGLDRVTAVIQGVDSNYRTDLFWPLIQETQRISGQDDVGREENFTPYRVIADHARAAAFLIADGVVPGNTGRNYIVRMIIRRAARFGSKIGLQEPFLAKIARVVIDNYGGHYAELKKNEKTILDNITREEQRFARTVEAGIVQLEDQLAQLKKSGGKLLNGGKAFDLYATLGLPLEITRDIAREQGLEVDEQGFKQAMEEHRLSSGGGKAMGAQGALDVAVFSAVLAELQSTKKLDAAGVKYDPYDSSGFSNPLLAIIRDGESVDRADSGDTVEIILPETHFYIESGGQVSDTGLLSSAEGDWHVRVDGVRRPAAGIISHMGEVVKGNPGVGDVVVAEVDAARRVDIQRNHTATHLLHAKLRKVLGEHARQAGSLVAPDRLRFDFTHPEALTSGQLEQVEMGVNHAILENYKLRIATKGREEAMKEGAMALFGEKYGDSVRTVTIGDNQAISYELCGGTHVDETGVIGLFLITSEGSAAAGIRRIEAVTGKRAYDILHARMKMLKGISREMSVPVDEVGKAVRSLVDTAAESRKQIDALRLKGAAETFEKLLAGVKEVKGIKVLSALVPDADADTLRAMTDRFRQAHPSGVCVLGSVVDGKPVIIAAVSDDLVKQGLHAGNLVKQIAAVIDGSGGGKPNLAQAGGKNPEKLGDGLAMVEKLIP
jgi:alanyl-tRNA synthetase